VDTRTTTLERDTLYAVIAAIAQGPDPARMLSAIVDVLTEATDCHACFVYLREGDRLRLRAASNVFGHAVDRVELGLDEGLAGWVARHREPAFIRDDALADPRMRYVPELDEERFQSMVAVPVVGRSDEVIGVVVLHTQAPREFGQEVLDLLVHVASLVAGAIENARLFEETRRQVAALTALSVISRDIAAIDRREDLYALAGGGIRRLLGCDAVRVYLRDPGGERLELAAAEPPVTDPSERAGTATLIEALHAAGTVLTVPLTAGSEHLGALAAIAERGFSDDEARLLRAAAHQLAVALKKAELIERLTEENIVRDLFEALDAGTVAVAEARARAARCDLNRDHVLVAVLPGAGTETPWPDQAERVEARLRRIVPGALCDAGRDRVRALLPVPRGADLADELDRLATAEGVAVGRGSARRGLREGDRALAEADDAARVAQALHPDGGSLEHAGLGAYRYLIRLPPGDVLDGAQQQAVARLIDYDRKRRTELTRTLERYLAERGGVTTTASALFIHPNTLRQRLDRIQRVAGIDLAREDLLSLELALKLARLHT
jgi:GAF domain-containing protein